MIVDRCEWKDELKVVGLEGMLSATLQLAQVPSETLVVVGIEKERYFVE